MKRALIGLHAEVVASTNASDVGLKGTIQDETKKTITINGKMVFKNNVTLNIDGHVVGGSSLVGRPEERVKQ